MVDENSEIQLLRSSTWIKAMTRRDLLTPIRRAPFRGHSEQRVDREKIKRAAVVVVVVAQNVAGVGQPSLYQYTDCFIVTSCVKQCYYHYGINGVMCNYLLYPRSPWLSLLLVPWPSLLLFAVVVVVVVATAVCC